MFNFDLVGYLAAFLTTISFLPQTMRIIKTGDTEAISFKMYALFVIGVFMWLIYGIHLGKIPIIIANAVTLILSGYILLRKFNDIRR